MLHVARFSLHCVSAPGSGEAHIAADLAFAVYTREICPHSAQIWAICTDEANSKLLSYQKSAT
jgi:hypothetical protein